MFNFTKYYYKFQIKESNSNRWVDAYFDTYWKILFPINYSCKELLVYTKKCNKLFYNSNAYNLLLRYSKAHYTNKSLLGYLLVANSNINTTFYDRVYTCKKTNQRLIKFKFIKIESNRTKEQIKEVIYEYKNISDYLKILIISNRKKETLPTKQKYKKRKRLIKFNGEKV